jgi:hypothetical protein
MVTQMQNHIAARTLAVAAKLGYGVDAAIQVAAMGMAENGATASLPDTLAKVPS